MHSRGAGAHGYIISFGGYSRLTTPHFLSANNMKDINIRAFIIRSTKLQKVVQKHAAKFTTNKEIHKYARTVFYRETETTRFPSPPIATNITQLSFHRRILSFLHPSTDYQTRTRKDLSLEPNTARFPSLLLNKFRKILISSKPHFSPESLLQVQMPNSYSLITKTRNQNWTRSREDT